MRTPNQMTMLLLFVLASGPAVARAKVEWRSAHAWVYVDVTDGNGKPLFTGTTQIYEPEAESRGSK